MVQWSVSIWLAKCGSRNKCCIFHRWHGETAAPVGALSELHMLVSFKATVSKQAVKYLMETCWAIGSGYTLGFSLLGNNSYTKTLIFLWISFTWLLIYTTVAERPLTAVMNVLDNVMCRKCWMPSLHCNGWMTFNSSHKCNGDLWLSLDNVMCRKCWMPSLHCNDWMTFNSCRDCNGLSLDNVMCRKHWMPSSNKVLELGAWQQGKCLLPLRQLQGNCLLATYLVQ